MAEYKRQEFNASVYVIFGIWGLPFVLLFFYQVLSFSGVLTSALYALYWIVLIFAYYLLNEDVSGRNGWKTLKKWLLPLCVVLGLMAVLFLFWLLMEWIGPNANYDEEYCYGPLGVICQ